MTKRRARGHALMGFAASTWARPRPFFIVEMTLADDYPRGGILEVLGLPPATRFISHAIGTGTYYFQPGAGR